VTEKLANETASYDALLERASSEGLEVEFVYAGDVLRTTDGVRIQILAPTKEYLTQSSNEGNYIKQSGEFANLVLHLQYLEFDVLLTGDSQLEQLERLNLKKLQSLEILQVPHHGSRSGLSDELMKKIKVQEAFISVGRNSYGHPHPITLQVLSNARISVRRTDKQGQINIVSNGKSYSLE
jgi:competence protein ComEC